uniref:Phage protein (ACLAME 621) n=1 Tax=uncultured Armatimonadetes bacterium TaxID=157466 RepID=A0A6J4I179_9BACT|nr:Phage protein (ACLAME 621) [uncultured Armatimonadetes bacterium]
MAFQRATRRRAFLKLGITGPSGSGKTFSGLQLAFGLAGTTGRVAVLDTENGSASLYAHLGEYDVMEIQAPFTVARYQEAIHEAARVGYDVLLIDSISHEWAGDGGLLTMKEGLDARGGNTFANWAKVTPLHEQFKSALLQAPLHVIVTMRSKQDYVMQEDGKGRCAPVKVGLSPIQRDGFEYELSVVFDVAMSHEAVVSKDRTGLFDGFVGRLTREHGRRIREWLETAPESSATGYTGLDEDRPAETGDAAATDPEAALRLAKMAFANEAKRRGHDVSGEGGKFSAAKVNALLRQVVKRPLPHSPSAADWTEGAGLLPDVTRPPDGNTGAAEDPGRRHPDHGLPDLRDPFGDDAPPAVGRDEATPDLLFRRTHFGNGAAPHRR